MSRTILVIGAAMLLLAGCGGGQAVKDAANEDPRPEWVKRGSGYYWVGGSIMIAGLGSAPVQAGLGPEMNAMNAGMAAKDVVKRLRQETIAALVRDFAAQHRDYFDPALTDFQIDQYVSQSMISPLFMGSDVVARWKGSGDHYALAGADMGYVFNEYRKAMAVEVGSTRKLVRKDRADELERKLESEFLVQQARLNGIFLVQQELELK